MELHFIIAVSKHRRDPHNTERRLTAIVCHIKDHTVILGVIMQIVLNQLSVTILLNDIVILSVVLVAIANVLRVSWSPIQILE